MLVKIFADNVLSLLVFILLFIVTLAEIFTPYLVYIISPGFITDNTKFNLAVEFTRITFPFLIFVCFSSFFSGILNSYNKFAAAVGAPIVLNVILIISILVSYFQDLNFAKQLSYGVTIAGSHTIDFINLFYFKVL